MPAATVDGAAVAPRIRGFHSVRAVGTQPNAKLLPRFGPGAGRAFIGILLVAVGVSVGGCVSSEPQAAETNSAVEEESPAVGADVHQASLDFLAERFNLNPPPEVSVVRFITSDEYATVVSECMNSAGFDALARSDSGIDFSKVPVEIQSTQEFGESFYRCTAQFPIDVKFYEPLTAAQFEKLHAYLKNELPDCMKALGYDAAELPSLTVFKETYGTARRYDPYVNLSTLNEPEYLELHSVCPPTLPSSELYG